MKIAIICSDNKHPIFQRLDSWAEKKSLSHDVVLVQNSLSLPKSGGDILFLISCHEVVKWEIRKLYRSTLVVHCSDLPQGRGWSPHIWQILEGKNELVITLLEADDKIDSGPIWFKMKITFEGHELFDEISTKLFDATLFLMDYAIENFPCVKPQLQNVNPTYYRRRVPADRRVDINRSIAEQFELLQVADPIRYPAFFDYRGHRYKLIIQKYDNEEAKT